MKPRRISARWIDSNGEPCSAADDICAVNHCEALAKFERDHNCGPHLREYTATIREEGSPTGAR